MVGLPYDLLANPLGAVRATFDKAIAGGSDTVLLDGKDWGVVDLFRQFLNEDDGISQVPFLNTSTFKWLQPNTLIRFRGMVQDMLGNELYVGAYKDGSVWRTNKYMDVSQFHMDNSSSMKLWDRRLFYCVPVPGLSSWAEIESEALNSRLRNRASQQRYKRRKTDDDSVQDMDMLDSCDEVQDSPSSKKIREEKNHFNVSQSRGDSAAAAGSSNMIPSMPGAVDDDFPCLVKIYDSQESEFKLNDLVEFIGIVTSDQYLLANGDEQNELSNEICEDSLVLLPSNRVRRLHCLIHRKLAVHDFIKTFPIAEPKCHFIKEIRESLLRHLTTVLGNDSVAAHLMLLHLISRVHARVDTLAVGKLSLNLTGFNKESIALFGNQLDLAVKNLLPFTQCIPLTVEYLNTTTLGPKKDYDTNRLVKGVLQLAEGSHLIIDETKLEAGTLDSKGVENARLLKNLMEMLMVEYDFQYYKMDMMADVQLLILSEGKSNILPADLVLPFRPSTVVSSSEAVSEEAYDAWRWYLATVRNLPHSIELDMQKVVENDLVDARQVDRSLSSQDFSRWLTMGRLMSASFGENCLLLEQWQMVKELERLRGERLR